MFKNSINDILAYFSPRFTVDANGCWLWMGRSGESYGTGSFNGDVMSAHRMSYMLFKGEVLEGLEVDHLCAEKRCVRPSHLELVTHAENIRRSKANMPTNGYKMTGGDTTKKMRSREWYLKNKERLKLKSAENDRARRAAEHAKITASE